MDVRGTRIRVQRWGDGSGPPILYWHGGGGGSDELRRDALKHFLTGLPEARLVAIPGAGHGVLGDNTPEVCRAVLAWLSVFR